MNLKLKNNYILRDKTLIKLKNEWMLLVIN